MVATAGHLGGRADVDGRPLVGLAGGGIRERVRDLARVAPERAHRLGTLVRVDITFAAQPRPVSGHLARQQRRVRDVQLPLTVRPHHAGELPAVQPGRQRRRDDPLGDRPLELCPVEPERFERLHHLSETGEHPETGPLRHRPGEHLEAGAPVSYLRRRRGLRHRQLVPVGQQPRRRRPVGAHAHLPPFHARHPNTGFSAAASAAQLQLRTRPLADADNLAAAPNAQLT